jgi:hypothetical protein
MYSTLKIKIHNFICLLSGWATRCLEVLEEHNSSFKDAENSVPRRKGLQAGEEITAK